MLCDVIVSVVVNAAQTENVLFGEDGCAAVMRPGSVFVMCSPRIRGWVAALESRLAERGILYLDAPTPAARPRRWRTDHDVTQAARGFEMRRVARRDGRESYRLGDRAGAGSRSRSSPMLLAGVHIAAAAEAHGTGAMREGVDPAALYEVITHSAGQQLDVRKPHGPLPGGDYSPLSAVDILR